MIYELISSPNSPRTDRHKLAGTVTIESSPAKAQVIVFDKNTMSVVASCWSKPTTGAWEISHINEYPENSLAVVINDMTGVANSTIFDKISQVTES